MNRKTFLTTSIGLLGLTAWSKLVDQEKHTIAKENYNASAEVSALKNEFAELRKSLTAGNNTIAKQVKQSNSNGLNEDILAKMANISEMSWEEVNALVREVQG